LSDSIEDDVLIYALFPQPGLKFLANRNNPSAFEPVPGNEPEASVASIASAGDAETYTVDVQGQQYVVRVTTGGDIAAVVPSAAPAAPVASIGISAPLAGNIFKVNVAVGDQVQEGDIVVVLEAMKMETEIRASSAGTVIQVMAREGDSVAVGATLVTLG